MFGAIIGDIVGSIYEFNNIKTTKFEIINKYANYTDDSLMTVAIVDWLLQEQRTTDSLIATLRDYGHRYPCPLGGFGGGFARWLRSPNPQPYNSWGNGSAMRVSAVGWAFDSLEETIKVARQTAEITHNHPEGIKGAEATAAAIFMARTGKTKAEIKTFIQENFGYDLNRTCDEIRPTYTFKESCQETVPEAMIAFLESSDFESAIRLAVSLGGDCDTLTCITGGIAEAFYKNIPPELEKMAKEKLGNDFVVLLERFDKLYRYSAN